jgi:hypothetical protein
MEIKDILTDSDIEEIKSRIVANLTCSEFLEIAPDKEAFQEKHIFGICTLKTKAKNAIENTAREILCKYIKDTCEKEIKPKIEEAAKRMMERFTSQVNEICNKIKWYWSLDN